jgi:hypothetical protein
LILPLQLIYLRRDPPVESEFQSVLVFPLANNVAPFRIQFHDQRFLLGSAPSFQLTFAVEGSFRISELFVIDESPRPYFALKLLGYLCERCSMTRMIRKLVIPM